MQNFKFISLVANIHANARAMNVECNAYVLVAFYNITTTHLIS
jgi:hypothetical protein